LAIVRSDEPGQPKRFGLSAWKWAAVVLLLYVFAAGWLVPLNPGITRVAPDRVTAGDTVELTVEGYNTLFQSGGADLRAWLRLTGDTVLQAYSVEAKDERMLSARFYVPSVFPGRQERYPLSLIIDQGARGISVLPNAVFAVPSDQPNPADMARWTTDHIGHLHKPSGWVFPFRNILAETIRNTYFHVPLWFGMILLFGLSAWHAYRYYRRGDREDDAWSVSYIQAGLLFGVLGLVTGMLWAKYTWNAYWSWDVKQNMAAIALLIYAGLMVLRGSVEDSLQRARLSAGYNLFAFALLIPLLFIIPRLTDSLHPGNGGNPALGGEDLDNRMRLVFYPAVIGFTLLGAWIAQLVYRIGKLARRT